MGLLAAERPYEVVPKLPFLDMVNVLIGFH